MLGMKRRDLMNLSCCFWVCHSFGDFGVRSPFVRMEP
jgi:hypothetical protein